MPPTDSKAELMRSLSRVVRGLSALFWGLPITILVCVRTAMSDWLRPLGMMPSVLATGLLCYGLWQLGYFQRQERVWLHVLDRAKVLALVNVGLSPFLYWWNRMPFVPFYSLALAILALSGLLFLFNLNQVLQRLAAMLPDETLRTETRVFTSLNLLLLLILISAGALYLGLQQIRQLPLFMIYILGALEVSRQWLAIFMVLLPLALTMTLIWKIKEVIMTSVFTEFSSSR